MPGASRAVRCAGERPARRSITARSVTSRRRRSSVRPSRSRSRARITDSGRDFATREDEVRHADECNWFGEWNAYGPAPFPSVPRIRRDAGVAIDPEIYRSLLGVASRAAVDAAYEYAADGRVVLVVDRGTTLAGIVCGRFAYGARIGIDGTDGRCTCPSWRAPCKHPLALWLVHRLVPTAASVSREALEPS